MVGLFQAIFIKSSILHRISHCQLDETKTGLGGLHGNKGSISTRLMIDDSSFCFINSHLAAHQSHISARNNDIAAVLKDTIFRVETPSYHYIGGGDGSLILDYQNVFFAGDLNYRIDIPRARVMSLIEANDWGPLQVN